MNRRVLLALYASVALAAPALAQDTFDWTGFHAGINAGYGSGDFRLPMNGSFSALPNGYALNGKIAVSGSGFVGGGQIGYDYLLPGNWLVGFEADAQGTTINPEMHGAGPFNTTGTYTLSYNSSLDFLGTARARIGYVLPQNVLVYGTGGLAYGGVSTDAQLHMQSGTDNTNVNINRVAVDVGWTVGAGVEYPVTDRVSLRTEYLYADLGSHTVVSGQLLTPSISGSGSINTATSAHIVRLALNYAFN